VRYLLLCGLILGLLVGNCEAVACQRITQECEYVFLVVDWQGEACEIEVRVITTDWQDKVREKVLRYTVQPTEGPLRLQITESVSIQNVKWYVYEIDPETKALRRPVTWGRHTVEEPPDMECQCGSWGTLEVYYHGELDEVRP
jgi:hypothetical protein